jgi:molybdenum cofactor guanylyltransferase
MARLRPHPLTPSPQSGERERLRPHPLDLPLHSVEREKAERPGGEVSGIILAGGKSRRLGVDKAMLRLDGGPTLIAETVARLLPLVDEIVIVADDGERFGRLPARIVPDLYPGAGSLGGIYTGLTAATHEHSLVVACDMPFLSGELMRHLLAEPRNYDVLLPRLESGFTEPLHAVYSRACLDPIRTRLEARRYRIIGFLDEVRVRYVDELQLRQLDPDLLSFVNINTPEELTDAVAMLHGAGATPIRVARKASLAGR